MMLLVVLTSLLFLQMKPLQAAGYLSGKHLRVGYLERPPDVYSEFSKEKNATIVRGALAAVLEWMSRRANFTYKFVPLDYKDGFNGFPKEIEAKKLNLVLNTFGYRHGRNLLVHYLYPTGRGDHSLVIPYPKMEANVWSAFLPYTWTVWLCLVLSAIAMIFLLNGAARFQGFFVSNTQSDEFITLSATSEYVVGVISNQGGSCSSSAWSVRLLAGTWCLAAVILVNAFSGSLITHLTIPTITPLINSLREVADRSEPQILTRSDSLIRTQLETSPLYSSLRDNVMTYARNYCGQPGEEAMGACVSLVKESGHVLLMESAFANRLLADDFSLSKKCELTLVEETYDTSYVAFVTPISSSHQLRNSLDVLLLEAESYGLLSKLSENQASRENPCAKYRRLQTDALRSLSLGDLSSAFLILGVGVISSIVIFIYMRFKKSFK